MAKIFSKALLAVETPKKFAYSSKCLKCENLSDWTSSDNRGRISSKRLFVSLKRTKRTYSKQAMLGRQTSAPARNRHTMACMHRFFSSLKIFHLFLMNIRAVSPVYVRVKTSHNRACKDISGPIDHFQQFWNDSHHERVKHKYQTLRNSHHSTQNDHISAHIHSGCIFSAHSSTIENLAKETLSLASNHIVSFIFIRFQTRKISIQVVSGCSVIIWFEK